MQTLLKTFHALSVYCEISINDGALEPPLTSPVSPQSGSHPPLFMSIWCGVSPRAWSGTGAAAELEEDFLSDALNSRREPQKPPVCTSSRVSGDTWTTHTDQHSADYPNKMLKSCAENR